MWANVPPIPLAPRRAEMRLNHYIGKARIQRSRNRGAVDYVLCFVELALTRDIF
jgi:hypothetical protein